MPVSSKPLPKKTASGAAKGSSSGPRPKAPWLQRLLMILMWGIVAMGCCGAWLWYDLPDLSAMDGPIRRPRIDFYDAQGQRLASYGDVQLPPLNLKSIPPYVPQAVLAIEDHRFYSHWGIDPLGMLRAVKHNIMAGRVVQGGSTLTQQLAKTLFFSSAKTFKRKAQELLVSLWLEHHFTKNQLLTLYLNRVYMGPGVYGFGAAAQYYYGKHIASISLVEAAGLAALLKGPATYAPSSTSDKFKQRTALVLKAMNEHGFITDKRLTKALKNLKAYKKSRHNLYGRPSVNYFFDWIRSQLGGYVTNLDQDLKVYTTLQSRVQKGIDTVVQNFDSRGDYHAAQVAIVVMSPQGRVMGMAGGRDYKESSFNRATQAQRQTGSTFKVPVFLTALKEGMTPQDFVEDTPVRIGSWKPRNYGWEPQGEISVQDALAYSVNAATVRLAQRVGAKKIIETAKDLGMIDAATSSNKDLTIALGSLESTPLLVTTAMATLANQCRKVTPYGIVKITSGKGKTLYERPLNETKTIVTPEVCYAMNQMLQANVAYGTAKGLWNANHLIGAKTGTSQGYRDAWNVGYDWPAYVIGVWVGNDDNTPLKKGTTGGKLPTQLWRAVINQI